MASIAACSETAAALAASSGSNGSPATAAPSSTSRAVGESNVSSSPRDAATAGGIPAAVSPAAAAGSPTMAAMASQLLDVERIAARLLVEIDRVLIGAPGQQLTHLRERQSAQFDSLQSALATRSLERSREALRNHSRAHREGNQHRCRGWASQKRGDELDRCRVGPMKVVEQEHEWQTAGELLQQGAHGSVAAVALVPVGDAARCGRR